MFQFSFFENGYDEASCGMTSSDQVKITLREHIQ